MKFLLFTLLFLIQVAHASTSECLLFEKVLAQALKDESIPLDQLPPSAQDLIILTRKRKSLGLPPEVSFQANSVDAARTQAMKLKAYKEFGFPEVNKMNWTSYTATMNKSVFKGKKVGQEIKLADGSWARVRIDWSPSDFGHYNIEMRVKARDLDKWETVNVQIKFPCRNGQDCTQEDILKIVEKLND